MVLSHPPHVSKRACYGVVQPSAVGAVHADGPSGSIPRLLPVNPRRRVPPYSDRGRLHDKAVLRTRWSPAQLAALTISARTGASLHAFATSRVGDDSGLSIVP